MVMTVEDVSHWNAEPLIDLRFEPFRELGVDRIRQDDPVIRDEKH